MLPMESNNLFSVHQHGFRGGHSCVPQLLEVIELWSKALDNGEGIDCLAFDTVPFERLIIK